MSRGETGGGDLQLLDSPADDADPPDGALSLDQLIGKNVTQVRQTVWAKPAQREGINKDHNPLYNHLT